MSEVKNCGVAAETKVETPEGSMTIRACAGKAIPVLTRSESGILFRMMLDVRKIADAHPVVKITLENGDAFRVAAEQVLIQADGQPVAAGSVQAGTPLLPAFHYPAGYQFQTDAGEARVSDRALKVKSMEAAGTAELYALRVNQTATFFLAAGILCQAEG